jgi:hypothetical protein
VALAPRTRTRPIGTITRGTTNPQRLRRVDRWLTGPMRPRWVGHAQPLFVDLGYGHSPVTTVELFHRLRSIHPGVTLIGLEISLARVHAAQPWSAPGLSFRQGGFELPLPAQQPQVIRAFNVLRQYPVAEVSEIWRQLVAGLAPAGFLIDGTCDELGRLATWVTVEKTGPQWLTLSWRLQGLTTPSAIAARLPKALIHGNIPGEPVHRFLRDLDTAWARAATVASFGLRQRFIATAQQLRASGWPLARAPRSWRLGELSVPWTSVAPTIRYEERW